MVADLFAKSRHCKATAMLAEQIAAENPAANHAKMLRHRMFEKSGELKDWNLCFCKAGMLPDSFESLVCSGDLDLSNNEMKTLPAGFHQLKVGGDLYLNDNQLQTLPEGFENISVGGRLHLEDNPLSEIPGIFMNVKGRVVR